MSIVMFPPHRPAVASTSNPTQCQCTSPNSSPLSINPPIVSSSIRKTTNQDVRVSITRHQDKLELIRNSLRPFAQNSLTDSDPQGSSPAYSNLNSEDETRRQIMLNTLTQIGYERTAASLALQFVQHSSVAAAAEFLLNINKDHKQEALKVASPAHRQMMQNPAIYDSDIMKYLSKYSACSSTVDTTQMGISSLEVQKTHQLRMMQTVNTTDNPFKYDDNFNKTQAICNNSSERIINPINSIPSSRNLDGCSRSKSIKTTPLMGSEILTNRITTERKTANILINVEKEARQRNDKLLRPLRSVPVEGMTVNNMNYLRRTDALPVIRTHIEQPQNTMLQIRVDANANGTFENSENQRKNKYINVHKNYPTEQLMAVHGENACMPGVKSIIVDPDLQSDNYQHYKQTNFRSNRDMDSFPPDGSSTVEEFRDPTSSLNIIIMDNMLKMEDEVEPIRCCSPLPESIQKKIENDTYVSTIKPSCARLFRFYMEQHVERLIQLYQERTNRFMQLEKEMECAKLPEEMRKQMLIFLSKKESRYLRLKRQKMNKNMFEVIKHIGFGAFGRVSLVRKKDTGKAYAMKTLRKREIIVKQQAAHVKAERDILAEANSQWIVKLYFSFQDEISLYFIMEYVPGGDMMQLLIAKGTFPESLARFYIAEMTCAIEYVHGLGFIHRDIKPDNILIDKNGHIKLTDFGLCTGLRWTHDKRFYVPCSGEENAKKHQALDEMIMAPLEEHHSESENNFKVLYSRNHVKRSRSHSLVGTDNYMAPEIILCSGHSQLCDWWSVGVILYEMVFGRPPFLSNDRYQTQFKIINWRQFLDLSNSAALKLSSECIHIIKRLCSDESLRLGRDRGAEDVKRHCWFKGINFDTLRSTTPEYIPRVDHAEDTSNFDTFDTDGTIKSLDKRKYSESNPAFYEFTFRHFFDYDGQGCPSLRQSPYKSIPELPEKFQRQNMTESDLYEREIPITIEPPAEGQISTKVSNESVQNGNRIENWRTTELMKSDASDERETDSRSESTPTRTESSDRDNDEYINDISNNLSRITTMNLDIVKDSKKEKSVGISLNKLKLNFVKQNKVPKENQQTRHKSPSKINRPDRLFPDFPKFRKLAIKNSVLRKRSNIFQSNESLNV